MKSLADWATLATRLPPYANFLFVLLLASVLADLTWRLVPTPVLPEPPAVSRAATGGKTTPVSARAFDIDKLHLFGEAGKQPLVVEEEIPEEAPDTQLRLTLKGVLAARESRNAKAIIADAGGQEDTYGIDDALPGGATLKEIHADRVILMHNGRFETLRLPEESVGGAVVTSMSRSTRTARANTTSRSRLAPSGVTSRITPQAAAVLKEYKQKLLADPQSVMDVVRAEPYRKGGRLMGYRVFPGRDRELLRKVGLQPGDVITSVNGIPLDSPLKGLEVMRELQGGGEVAVDILRNGVTQSYVVPAN